MINAFAGKEVRMIFDFVNGILYGTVIAERRAWQVEAGQIQNSNAVTAVAANGACHPTYIIQPLHLLCKCASAV